MTDADDGRGRSFVAREVTTRAGGDTGHEDGDLATARFWEPSGLSPAGSRLDVADTNNHAIRLVDLDAGTVQTLEITGT